MLCWAELEINGSMLVEQTGRQKGDSRKRVRVNASQDASNSLGAVARSLSPLDVGAGQIEDGGQGDFGSRVGSSTSVVVLGEPQVVWRPANMAFEGKERDLGKDGGRAVLLQYVQGEYKQTNDLDLFSWQEHVPTYQTRSGTIYKSVNINKDRRCFFFLCTSIFLSPTFAHSSSLI